MVDKEKALRYHSDAPRGKIEVVSTKPCETADDLSLAYTPGVAFPCLEIAADPNKSFEYTSRGNLVAVISNGSAVLGLGNIGAAAGKPVMEGKGVLFKRFGGIDVFDLELNTADPDEIIKIVKSLEPTFGGINLEDIKAPECFYIEETLRERMDIPVFHDDQHGTAIISGAALINACEILEKEIGEIRMVVSGAGAGGLACAQFFISLGLDPEKLIVCDSKGVIHEGRKEGMNEYKQRFVAKTEARTLADALDGADAFVGLSGAGLVNEAMLKSMADRPIIFALANPDPEIAYDLAKAARPDAIVATGRSDCPNQVNNVLGFPFIFRAALDVRASTINEPMKLAAAFALAKLAREQVPFNVYAAYGSKKFTFGPEYIIPKPFDYRVASRVAPAVAKAALDSGVARKPIEDMAAYTDSLERLFGRRAEVVHHWIARAKSVRKKIVFPEGEQEKVIMAAQSLVDEGIANPILIGRHDEIMKIVGEHSLDFVGVEIVNPYDSENAERFARELFHLRSRAGVTATSARSLVLDKLIFGMMMVRTELAHGLVAGLTYEFDEIMQRALEIIGQEEGVHNPCGVTLLITKKRLLWATDTVVQIDPTAEHLASAAMLAAETAGWFGADPRVAFLSFSNFGSVDHEKTHMVRRAVELLKEMCPGVIADGEMQADTALSAEIMREDFPFCQLDGPANVLVFPGVASASIATKLLAELDGVERLGPIIRGLKRPVNILQHSYTVEEIVELSAITAVESEISFWCQADKE